MRARQLLLIVAITFSSVAARHRAVSPRVDRLPAPDQFSAAQPADIEVTHVSLDLTVDFDARSLRGSATLDVANHKNTSVLILDTQFLDIQGVYNDGVPTTWHFAPSLANGTPLVVDIDARTHKVRVDYNSRATTA
jgi:aminopeptidase N